MDKRKIMRAFPMKHVFYILISCFVSLIPWACSPASVGETPISVMSSTPIIVPSKTPTSLPAFTPSFTDTPPPQPELTYIISISETVKNSLHVILYAKNMAGKELVLTFWTNAENWDTWLNPADNVSNLTILSESGQAISSKWGDDGISWTGEHGLHIDNTNPSNLVVEYDVKLGFLDQNFHADKPQYMGGFLSKSFGFAEPEFIFLAPNDIEQTTYKMQVIFDLPDGWQTATHWRKINENEYEVITRIGEGGYSSIEFANGAIAFGDIYKEEQTIGNTAVNAVVVGYPDDVAEKLTNLTMKNFEYYTTLLGPTPLTRYIMVFVPPTVGGNYVNPYNENIGGCFTRIYVTDNLWNTPELWWINISHPMLHNWNGFLNGEFWYGEGITSYYELKAIQVLGIHRESAINFELSQRLARYEQEILGTANDFSLQEASKTYESNNHGFPYDFITYKKGSLFAYLLDQEITRRTNGDKSLDDVMHYLFEQEKTIDSNQLLEGIFAITGEDFSQLINDYLLDNKPLPLVRSKNGISVDVEKLSP